jgi:hypothetical protein
MNRISLVLLLIGVSLISMAYGQANQTPLNGEKTILINRLMEDIFGYLPGGDLVPFYEMEVPTITVVRAGVHPHFHQSFYNVDTIKPEVVKMAT